MDELETLAAKRVGSRLGAWTIEAVLGVGAMASVFRARHVDGSAAALKVLHPHLSEVAEVRKRFVREGPLGNALATVESLRGPNGFSFGRSRTRRGGIDIRPEGRSAQTVEILRPFNRFRTHFDPGGNASL